MATTETTEDTECPTCGRDDFATERAMKTHHMKQHGESLSLKNLTCFNCGADFTRRECHISKGEDYCSQDCMSEFSDRLPSGEDHHNSGSSDQRLNSREWLHQKYTVEGLYVREIADIVDKEGSTVRHHMDRHNIELRSQGAVEGEDNPMYAGGPFQYGAGFNNRKKQRVRLRDQFRCQDCGMTQADHIEKHGESLHVHHITPAREFNDADERNAMENLIALCQQCHLGKWEQIAPLRPDIRPAAD